MGLEASILDVIILFSLLYVVASLCTEFPAATLVEQQRRADP